MEVLGEGPSAGWGSSCLSLPPHCPETQRTWGTACSPPSLPLASGPWAATESGPRLALGARRSVGPRRAGSAETGLGFQGSTPGRPAPTTPSARLWREAAALSWGEGGRPGLCLWSLAFPSRTREGCPRGTSPVPAAVGGWRGPPRARGNQGGVRVSLPPRACPALQRRCPRTGASMARWRGRQGPPTPGGWRGEVVGCVVSGQ